ncbi:hypothetical protein GZH47_02540 [Paenibacillus rhizovicinus]|uniref:Uncharacterized protein n=1 Tax=Paenibacillus rhizovicinus TaxID=2704463 RepID=A0A6C0NUC1_9BACL|nr:hypothetical protein [Paenibacillus rhizovicinus]QHW29820.1 hypothetical protein GZH47_02540 [Paenibacillus rhizovicinus]
MESITQGQGVTIENLGMLDLTGKKTDELSGIALIQNVGLILVPQSLSDALMKVPQRNVGLTVSLPEPTNPDAKMKLYTGQLTLSGEVFSNAGGSPDDILVIAGQVVISSPIVNVGYGDIIIAGQILAPKGSEALLSAKLTRLTGQIIYYKSDAPRIFIGNDSFSRSFFELIDSPMSMALVGNYEIEQDVDIALMKQKVSELILIGNLTAPKPLVPLLQLLAEVKLGDITGKDDADAPGA